MLMTPNDQGKGRTAQQAVPLDPPVGPKWDDDGMPLNLLAAAEDADEWLALIERLHALRRWKFSEPDSLSKLRACRAELRRFMTPNDQASGGGGTTLPLQAPVGRKD